MGRQPCCDKIGLKRGPWSMDEDQKLMNFILNNGIQCWRLVPKLAGLMRCGKSCRLRWINYLRPDLKRGSFTEAEENMIIQLHSRFGNRWSKIASHFPGRTDNEIKNHWNTRIKKKLKDLGLDSVTNNLTPKQLISQDEKEYKPSNSTKNQGKGTKTIDTDSRDDNSDGISKGEGASEFGPSESSNYFYNTETWPPSEVSLGTSAEVFDDYYQPWIHSPKNMLPWDNFSIFDEILFYIPQNLDGTNV